MGKQQNNTTDPTPLILDSTRTIQKILIGYSFQLTNSYFPLTYCNRPIKRAKYKITL